MSLERKGLKGTYAAPAIEKAFEIIEALGQFPDGALISEMATRTGRSVGELFRLVVVMEQLGYLHKSPETDRYRVAYKLLDLAYRATPAQDLGRAALPVMRDLAQAAGQSCHLVVAGEGAGLVIASESQPGPRGFALRVGANVDMLRSCSGQVLLAFAAPSRAAQLAGAAMAVQGLAHDAVANLEPRLAAIRAAGFDSRQSPVTHGVTDISYPIFGFNGEVAAALTIPFLELIDGSQKVDLASARQLLADAAARISGALGHQA